ncbi:MAG TPA: ammonium transporter [Bryobacteraceae bacterium]|nr:ammonium transporter [Bryobacteraceae bacterium]
MSALCLFFILLAPLAAAGLALINAGLGRARSAAHSILSALCVVAVAVLIFFAVGFSWQGYMGRPDHTLAIHGKPWSWIASEPFFLGGLQFDGSPASLAALLGLFSAGLAAMIPLGSGSDRWRLGAMCASTAILAGWTYPLFAHWAWGGGWLAQLGANYGLGRGFLDSGGAASIQVVGGLTALAITWIIGPRRGKYTAEGMPAAIPGHNAVFTVFGCFLAWLGWIGLGAAGAMLFAGAASGRTVLVAVNTTLAAAAAALAAAGITRARFGKADASLCANGWIAGLVASSAASALFRPAASALIGAIAGAMVVYSVEWLELYLSIDDPSGAISVHALGGLWGVIAAGLFVPSPDGGSSAGQWLAQLAGIATLLGFVLPLTYGLNWLLNRVYPQRVAAEGERQGLDLHELGAGAYPDFMSHNEDLWQR